MKTTTAVVILIIVLLVGGGLYYWYAGSNGAYGSPSGAAGINGSPNQGNLGGTDTGTPQQPAGPATLNTSSNSQITGNFLTAANGMTLYSPQAGSPEAQSCTGACAQNWPPYTVQSASDINISAAMTGTIGTVARAGGSLQVTYNGSPLYFYAKDAAPGQTNGQGAAGIWYVATP